MKSKRGSTLLSALMTIGGVSAIAAAGFVFTGGECGVTGSCGDKADAKVVAASNTETAGKSCCDLGALAKKPAQATVLPAANAKSDCSAKSCRSDKAAAKVVEASNVEKAECASGESCCKGDAKVVEVANVAKADGCCSSKAEAKVVEASNTAKSDSCCSSKAAPVVVEASNVEKADCAKGESCCKAGTAKTVSVSAVAPTTCASKTPAATMPVAAVSSCCSAKSTSNAVAKLDCGSKNAPVRIVASSTPIVMPAMFFQAVSMQSFDMTEAGCCRSAAANASGLSTCSGVAADGSEKSCCDEGMTTIPASNVEASDCSKGDSCCSADAKVVEASNAVEADCSKGESCCSADAKVVEANNVEKAECAKGESCCKADAAVIEASNVEKSECSGSCAEKCDKAKEVASN